MALFFFAVLGAGVVRHGDLESSVPKSGSKLSKIPSELRLKFTEAPELAVTHVKLLGPDAKEVALGALTVVGKAKVTVVAPISGAMVAGKYTVEWEMAGDDGHAVDGKFTFTVLPVAIAQPSQPAQPEAGTVPAPVPTQAPVAPTTPDPMDPAMVHHDTVSMPSAVGRFNSESVGYVAVRILLYSALLVVLGTVAFRLAVLPLASRSAAADASFVADAARRAASAGSVAACVLIGAVLARLVAQSLALNGASEMMNPTRVGALLTGTKWGWGWFAQLVSSGAALYGLSVAGRRAALPSQTRVGWTVLSIAAVILAFTPALASHAAASQQLRPLAILMDGLHVAAASGWVGGLFLVVAAGIPAAMAQEKDRRAPAVAALINAFSPTALGFAATLLGTGLFAAWLHLGGFAALWEAKYGNVLLIKLSALSLVTLTGAYNWLQVKPALGSLQGVERLRRSAAFELIVSLVVIVITAVLVATPPPMRIP